MLRCRTPAGSQILQARCVALQQQVGQALGERDELQAVAEAAQAACRAAEVVARQAQGRAAVLDRRLGRAKAGGREVADAAEEIHQQLLDAREWASGGGVREQGVCLHGSWPGGCQCQVGTANNKQAPKRQEPDMYPTSTLCHSQGH